MLSQCQPACRSIFRKLFDFLNLSLVLRKEHALFSFTFTLNSLLSQPVYGFWNSLSFLTASVWACWQSCCSSVCIVFSDWCNSMNNIHQPAFNTVSGFLAAQFKGSLILPCFVHLPSLLHCWSRNPEGLSGCRAERPEGIHIKYCQRCFLVFSFFS